MKRRFLSAEPLVNYILVLHPTVVSNVGLKYTGVGHGTSIREVYFFGPKSILFLLKYAQIYFFVAIEDITTEFWAKFGISRKIIA